MITLFYIIRDICVYTFIFFVSVLSLREGYYGVKHQMCRVPLARPPLFEGYGIEAVIWGTLYLLVGILYTVLTLETTIKLLLATFR